MHQQYTIRLTVYASSVPIIVEITRKCRIKQKTEIIIHRWTSAQTSGLIVQHTNYNSPKIKLNLNKIKM